MTTPNPKISEMINDAPVKSAAAEKNITQLEDTQEELQEEIDAIEDDVCGAAADELETYLETTKLAEIRALYPANPDIPPNLPPYYDPVYFVKGGTYGSINYTTGNITDWEFLQYRHATATSPPATLVRYVYTPGEDPDIDLWVSDFDFGNDYLTRPLDTGASYGLYPLYSAYGSAKSNVQAGKNKVDASVDILRRYL